MKIKLFTLLVTSLVAMTFAVGCGGDDDDNNGNGGGITADSIATTPLSGTVNGKPFEILHGHATFSEERQELNFTFQPVESDSDCSGTFGFRDEQIIFSRPAVVGGGPMSFENNITFAYNIPGETEDDPGISQNDVAVQGYWEITEITDDKVVGGLFARTDDHEVSGTFEVTKCPDPFDNF